MLCLSCFNCWNISEQKKLGIKVLIVQTGMFVSKHDRIIELKNEIFKYRDADIVIFSESPVIGFKEGSRTAFSREILGEIKNKRDGKLYIINSYGLIDNKKLNNNLTLYIMNGNSFIRYKRKLVPFWETPGLFYREGNWESPYFSIPLTNGNQKYKFRDIYINSYICYEAMFVNHSDNVSDLTIIQSNYESFHKGYDSVVKSGNVLAYVNKSHRFKNFISVQNMGGTIFVDSSGRFHWDVYKTSKEKSVFLLEI
ncbi:TPA: acyltransferase [Escherichia coli]|nr:acyltransferase [Escherichia coli]